MPTVTPEETAKAKSLLEGLKLDMTYSAAKRRFERDFGWDR